MSGQLLRVVSVHLDVEHGQTRRNLEQLVWLCRNAAAMGAQIICAPEMCLSGYVFDSRRAISPLVETIKGKAVEALRTVALESQSFLVAGLAEKDVNTGVFYNSALALAPNGQLVCHYRKINSEARWAAPGPAAQENVFQTPWGGIGLLICSDVYYSLLPRLAALKGASLLLTPANWPASGEGFPLSLWRLRAMENGFWLLAANRGGEEPAIDFSRAKSCLIEPGGTLAKSFSSVVDERVKVFDIPLDQNGHVPDLRKERLASRQTEQYHRLYCNISKIGNLTRFLALPEPGQLDVHALAPGEENPVEFLASLVETLRPGGLVLLPLADYSDEDLKRINYFSKKANVAIVGFRNGQNRPLALASRSMGSPMKTGFTHFPVYEWGPARIMLADLESVWHPELALAAAKEGVDLILCSQAELSKDDELMLTLRPIEQVALAAAGRNLALVSLIPHGHGPGRGSLAQAGHMASYPVDTRLTRSKTFLDIVDYPGLFRKPVLTSAWGPGNRF
ncbi:MAG: hypothetical protein LBJ64_06670 [Deltaproteobacteria bacterium]|nr:hypothetical protein [Deltaproteobacteria bacterium]